MKDRVAAKVAKEHYEMTEEIAHLKAEIERRNVAIRNLKRWAKAYLMQYTLHESEEFDVVDDLAYAEQALTEEDT
jgi:hypothetical protein